MQRTDITSFPVPDKVKDDWQFAEVWIEPMLSPPYILLLLGEKSGSCRIFDPAKNYASFLRVPPTTKRNTGY